MSGKLEFSFNSSKLAEFLLDKEVMTIGRKEDNDIRIENLAVSGHHARILTIFEDSFLEDLSSTNGTYVNGKAIDKHPLKHGDVIVIGKHELQYVNDSKQFGDDNDKTVLIRRKPEVAATPARAPVAANPAPTNPHSVEYTPAAKEANTFDSAKLQILNGKSAGKELPLVKSSVKLGKSGAEVVQINKRPDGHFIVCLDQASDEFLARVNGEVIGSRAIKLQNHDVIEINRLKIEYYLSSRAN